jgi:hypothetical protein
MDRSPNKIQRSARPLGYHNDETKVALPESHLPPEHAKYTLSRSGYRVRLADSPGQRNKVSMLINSMYSCRGYATDDIAATLPHDPNRITLEASDEKKLFGTLTLGLDSSDGLLADELYGPEINILRRMGRKVCEMTKLAFNPEHSSKEVIAALFHLAYIYAHNIYRCNDVLIEVNPRHAAFYQRRLGFQQIGELRNCPRVDAPAILLHVGLDYGETQILKHGGSRDTSEKSLYPYFFSEQEVQGLIHRIRYAGTHA